MLERLQPEWKRPRIRHAALALWLGERFHQPVATFGIRGGYSRADNALGAALPKANSGVSHIWHYWVLAIVFLLLPQHRAHAEAERWARLANTLFHHIARDNDMPDSAVPLAMGQDAQGFLWVGTEGGLARWDGYRFRLYHADSSVAYALPENVVTALHRDTGGRFWIGTDGAGLVYYEPATDHFIPVELDPADPGVAGVSTIIDDGAAGLWVGTGAGLFHLNHAMRKVARIGAAGGLADATIESVLRDHTGALWVGTASGLARAAPGSTVFTRVSLSGALADGETLDVDCLLEDHAGTIWVGTRRHGAFMIGADRGVARKLPAPQDQGNPNTSYGVMAALEVRPGEIWLGTDGHGILAVNADTLEMRSIQHDPSVQTSLADNAIRALYQDKAGLVWVCTFRGISAFDPAQHAVVTLFGVPGQRDGIADTDVRSMLSMPDGRIWVGLRYHGIDILDPSAGRVGAIRPDPANPETALPAWSIVSLVPSPSSGVLAGTSSGLYRIDAAGQHVARLEVPGRRADEPVLCLCRCHGSVWLGGPDGLWELMVSPLGQMRVLRHEDASLTDPRVQVLAPGPDGAVWAGTQNGLNLVAAEPGKVERIFPNRGDPTQLFSGDVVSLATDRHGRLWAGSLDNGVNVMLGRSAGRPVFRRITVKQGLPNNDVSDLEMDGQGKMWLGTDNGLAVVDPESLAVRSFGQADGVGIATYWNNASATTPQGEILFGGLGGMTVVRPSLVARSITTPPIVVTSIRVGGKPVLGAHEDGEGQTTRPLVIQPDANSFSVEFAALDYPAPANNRYAYRLDGYDPDWVENESEPRLAAYTNLPPGDYVLRLRGSNRRGTWVDPPLSVPITVLPSWYQTIWFRLLAVVVVGALVAGVVQLRTAWLRRRQHELERQVAERTAELSLTQTQLRHFAYADMLTGLPNRRAFTEEFRKLLEEAQETTYGDRSKLALLLIDLDGFKTVNDTMGHDAGDALLVAASARLRGAVREHDYVARLGGDEFAVLLPGARDEALIDRICTRIIASFAAPVLLGTESVKAGASIGVAVFPDHGITQEAIYKSADIAMYAAKRSGRGTWRCSEQVL